MSEHLSPGDAANEEKLKRGFAGNSVEWFFRIQNMTCCVHCSLFVALSASNFFLSPLPIYHPLFHLLNFDDVSVMLSFNYPLNFIYFTIFLNYYPLLFALTGNSTPMANNTALFFLFFANSRNRGQNQGLLK